MDQIDAQFTVKLSVEEQVVYSRTVDSIRKSVLSEFDQTTQSGAVKTILFKQLHQGVEQLLVNHADENTRIACKKLCSHCCSAKVEAFLPEVFNIVDQLRTLAQSELGDIVQRLRTHQTENLHKDATFRRTSCPFLIDHLCSIYAVRPSACRRAHSLDVHACATGEAQIPQSLSIILGAAALVEGSVAAYAEKGYNTSKFELVAGVLDALAGEIIDNPSHSEI
jgi:Fe-S-cluster containining protein